MYSGVRAAARFSLAATLLGAAAFATMLPRLSFEDLTDNSDMVVSGTVTRSWTAWDAGHKYIWTHYEVAVDATHKGDASHSVEIAEPGGIVGDRGMMIAGSVTYWQGQNVVIFAQRMPNGFLRTTGWGQGKYEIDRDGLLHGDSTLKSVERIQSSGLAARVSDTATPLTSLERMSVRELSARIAARVQLIRGGGR